MAAAVRCCRALASDGTSERTCSGAGSHHGAQGSFWRLWLHQLLPCPASTRACVPRFLPPPPCSKPAVVGQVQGLLLLPSSHLRTLWLVQGHPPSQGLISNLISLCCDLDFPSMQGCSHRFWGRDMDIFGGHGSAGHTGFAQKGCPRPLGTPSVCRRVLPPG